MYLRSLTLTGFRSCASTRVLFDETLTVLAGENNAGKTNVVDALRLMTSPTEVRRSRFLAAEDVRLDAAGLRLEVEFAGLDPSQRGLFISALRSNGASEALWQMSWSPPTGVARRRSPTWTVGPRCEPDGEAEVRDLIRHVHLHALRDADRDLASSSPGRIEFLLRQLLLGKDAEQETLLASARAASATVLKERPLVEAQDRILRVFSPLSAGFHPHEVHLRFADPTLVGLARDLRLSLAQHGVEPSKLAQTGLGYSNLLYLATVLVELGAARDAELTLLLVEEPEAHLHPQLQRATLAFLQRQAAESARSSKPGEYAGRVQVIVTTHSPNVTAATSVRQIVVLRAGEPSVDVQPMNAASKTKPLEPSGAATSPPERARVSIGTSAIAISDLGLDPAAARKIDRYLDVTKASLLFGRRVLLLEGIAEALLFPEFAASVLDDDELARFRAAAVIAIDGVDFEPYVRLLLTCPTATPCAIADRVVVVTDEDAPNDEETEPGDAENEGKETPVEDAGPQGPTMGAGRLRAMRLEAIAETLGARERLHVEVTPQTLEASLIADPSTGAAASTVLKEAFVACGGGVARERAWRRRIEDRDLVDRGKALLKWMASTRTRKGDFAQVLASTIESRRSNGMKFAVPPHIVRALRALVGVTRP